MLQGIRQAFRLEDLRRRILITILILVVYRLAANIPVAGVDREALQQLLASGGGLAQLANILDLLSGGAVSQFSVLALGVYPYVTASIIIQLLTPIVPALEELQKEGQAGRDTLNRYTYYLTIPMALFQVLGQLAGLSAGNFQAIIPGFGADPLLTLTVLATMVAGTMIAIWMGELISEQGIGNGLSMIIFAGIVARLPAGLQGLASDQQTAVRNVVLFTALTVFTVLAIVVVQEGARRIPVVYGKRVRGNKLYGGQSTYVPLKVNMAGMIPLIFAQAILVFPALLAGLFANSPTPWLQSFALGVSTIFGQQGGTRIGTQVAYWLIYFLTVAAFTYFYTDVLIQNQNLADNLQKNGGFIKGIRPGKRTAEYITRVSRRITFVGAMFLGIIAVLPGVIGIVLQLSGANTLSLQQSLLVVSGGSLIIVVNVVLDTLRQLEAQMVARHRDAFIGA